MTPVSLVCKLNYPRYCPSYRHGGTVISAAASQQDGRRFDSGFLPQSETMPVRCTGNSKVSVGVCRCPLTAGRSSTRTFLRPKNIHAMKIGELVKLCERLDGWSLDLLNQMCHHIPCVVNEYHTNEVFNYSSSSNTKSCTDIYISNISQNVPFQSGLARLIKCVGLLKISGVMNDTLTKCLSCTGLLPR